MRSGAGGNPRSLVLQELLSRAVAACIAPATCLTRGRSNARRWPIAHRNQPAFFQLIGFCLGMVLSANPFLETANEAHANEILGPYTQSIRLPAGRGRAVGFRTSIRASRTVSVGYVPVEITVSSPAALPADRRLVYRFTTIEGGQTPPQNGLQIDVPILIPQGTRNASWVRYLPKWSAGFALEVTVFEEGRAIPDYNDVLGNGLRPGRRKLRSQLELEYGANWVFISPDDTIVADQVPNLQAVWPEAYLGATSASSAFWSQMLSGPTVLGVGQSGLPTDWRGYQNYDVVILSTLSAERLVGKEEQWRALRGWILNGGSMVIYDAESPQAASKLLRFAWSNDEEAATRIERGAEAYERELRGRRSQADRYIADLRIDFAESAMQKPNSLNTTIPGMSGMTGGLSNSNQPNIDFEKELERWQERKQQLAKEPSYSLREWSRRVQVQSVGSGEVFYLRRTAEGEIPPAAYWSIVKHELDYRVSPIVRRGVDPMVGDRRFSALVDSGRGTASGLYIHGAVDGVCDLGWPHRLSTDREAGPQLLDVCDRSGSRAFYDRGNVWLRNRFGWFWHGGSSSTAYVGRRTVAECG